MGRWAGSQEPAGVVDVGSREDAARTALLALAYGVLAGALRAHPSLLALAWPAGGVAALWLATSWGRPALLARDGALVVLVTVVAYSAVGASLARGVAVGVCALMSALVTVLVLQRLSGGRPQLRRPADLLAVLGASAVGGLVPALVAPSLVHAADGDQLPLVMWPWLLRGAVSTFVVLAVGIRVVAAAEAALVRLRRPRSTGATARPGAPGGAPEPSARPSRLVEAGAVVALLVGALATGAGLDHATPVALLLLLPCAAWVGLRLPTTWAALVVLAGATAAVLLTDAGVGPAQTLPPGLRGTTTQVLVGVVGAVVLTVALHRDALAGAAALERAARRRAQEQAHLLTGVLASAREAVVVVEASGRVLLDNAAARELLGGPAAASCGSRRAVLALRHLDGSPVAEHDRPLVRALRGGTTSGRELVLLREDGGERRVVVSARPLPGRQGQHAAVVTLHDVTRERAAVAALAERERSALAALAESERLLRQALDASPLGMLVLPLDDGPRRVLRTNPALVRLLARTDLEGQDVSAVADPTDLPVLRSALDAMADGVTVSRLELRLLGPGGRRLRCACAASVVQRGDGRREAVLLVEDVTARSEAGRALTQRARCDPLTGLPDRVVLIERLSALVRRGVRADARVGLLRVDLERLEEVVDAEGRAVGDAVLREAARRLTAVVRPGDTVARLGGRELAVVCPGISGEADLAGMAQRVVDALGTPFDPPARRHGPTASAGAALAEHGDDATSLLVRADEAVREAGRAGGDRWASAPRSRWSSERPRADGSATAEVVPAPGCLPLTARG